MKRFILFLLLGQTAFAATLPYTYLAVDTTNGIVLAPTNFLSGNNIATNNAPLSAALLTSGTLLDARLSTNVPLLNASSNVFSGDQYVNDIYGDTLILTTPVPIESGGTERATLTSQALLYGNGTGPVGLLLSSSNTVVGWDAAGNLTNYPISSFGSSSTLNVVSDTNSSAAPDFTAGHVFKYTMTNNFSLLAPTNVTSANVDRMYTIHLIQDGTGTRSPTIATNYQYNGTIAGITVTTNANYTDMIRVYVVSTNRFTIVGHATGVLP